MGFGNFLMAVPEGTRVTTGSKATVTFAKPAIALILKNESASDDITIYFKDGSNNEGSFMLPKATTLTIDQHSFPYVLNSFSHQAVANTPALVWIAFEIQ